MNLSLLDPSVLAQDCPETFSGTLKCGHSTCLKFSHQGDFLASGRSDGSIVIFDVETHDVARKLRGHIKTIISVSWSRDGRYLLSASQDWKCVLWDLKDGIRFRTVRFNSIVWTAELHPSNPFLFIAPILDDNAMLVDVSSESAVKKQLPSVPRRVTREEIEQVTENQLAKDAKQKTVTVTWSKCGNYILSGTNSGWLNIIDGKTCKMIYSNKVVGQMITLLRVLPSGREVLCMSSDRTIRTFRLPDLEKEETVSYDRPLERECTFTDQVNHEPFHFATFSSSGEYIVGAAKLNFNLYLWERTQKSLLKFLEGAREEILMIEWHPNKPFLAASGVEHGYIYLWSINAPQRWSALAPDFVEVEENVEYVEREDEFDIRPQEEAQRRALREEDEDVDVLTVDSKYGHQQNSFRMPILLDIEDSDSDEDIVAIGAGQFRRRSPGLGKDWAVEDDSEASTKNGLARSRNASTPTVRKRRRNDERD